MKVRFNIIFMVIVILFVMPGCNEPTAIGLRSSQPNILLIVADDLGYADLGVYGSDILTPNIDKLAAEGILFTQFHTSPYCAPSRAMLLSGNNNHVAGIALQGANGLAGKPVPGYENYLSDRISPFSKLLKEAGYHTYTVGKWHLGREPENSPRSAGFEKAFTLLQGAGTYFDAIGYAEGGSLFRGDKDLVDYPVGQYATDVYTQKLIDFIDSNKGDGKPFFAYAAYTAPHWPLQVPDAYLDLYSGRYDDGYDALRERRFESLKEAGIIPSTSRLPPRNDAITPWVELNPEERRLEVRKMELYAALLHNLDDHIGHLLEYLRVNDLYDDTLIIFMSDNGAAGEDYYSGADDTDYLRMNFDNAYEKMGTSESFVFYGAPWAEAGSAPFQRYKGFTREGGIVAPMIITGPNIVAEGIVSSEYVTVMDIAPTLLEVTGASYPNGASVRPMLGESMYSYVTNMEEAVHGADYVTTMSHGGKAFLRRGDWKISNLEAPFDESEFELFNLADDPGESINLAAQHPEKLAELIGIWRVQRKELGIILPSDL